MLTSKHWFTFFDAHLFYRNLLCVSVRQGYIQVLSHWSFWVANQSVNMSLILHVRQELRVGVTKSTTQSRRNQTCRLTVNILRMSILDALGATKGCTLFWVAYLPIPCLSRKSLSTPMSLWNLWSKPLFVAHWWYLFSFPSCVTSSWAHLWPCCR
jgi:hypothetical protein